MKEAEKEELQKEFDDLFNDEGYVMDEARAKKEVVQWLLKSRFSRVKIKKSTDVVDSLIEALREGRLTVKTDGKLEYQLIAPLKWDDESMFLEKVTIKNRINYNMVKPHMQDIKADDAIGLMHAYGCAMIGDEMSTFTKMDTRDSGFIRGLAPFFF